MGMNSTHVSRVSKVRWEGGTRSCLDEADELRRSLCLLRSSEIPNPRSTSSSGECRCSAQEWFWLLLLHDEGRLFRLSVFSKDIFKERL